MRFWQKTFLAVLLLFLLGFDVLLVGVLVRSGRLNEQLVVQSAQTEMGVMRGAIEEKLRSVSEVQARFTVQALRMHLRSVAELYGHDAAFFQIETEAAERFSSRNSEWVDTANIQEEDFFLTQDGRMYYVQSRPIYVTEGAMHLMLFKDVSQLTAHREQMLRFGIVIYVVVSLLLASILLVLLLRLTKPLRTLTRTAQDIAQGQYDKRVDIRQRDEIGAFAGSFNRMADAVQRQMVDLETSNTQRQWFIDSLSHELRTPVTAIVGYGEVLRYANVSPEDRDKALAYIIEQGNRISILSEKLLDLARLQHGQIAMVRTDLGAAANRAAQSLRQSVEAKGVALSMDVAETMVKGDAALLETLSMNLLENAVRACGEGGHITVRVWQERAHASLAIGDDGIGIAKEEQQRILDAFYRVDPSRSRKNGGVGLGLALCNQICLLHHATLRIDSALGEGCTVTVEFTTPQQG